MADTRKFDCPVIKTRSGEACGRVSVYAESCGRCSAAHRQKLARAAGRAPADVCACGCLRTCRTRTGYRNDCRPQENARARSARYRAKIWAATPKPAPPTPAELAEHAARVKQVAAREAADLAAGRVKRDRSAFDLVDN
jgi:hypothetical protein